MTASNIKWIFGGASFVNEETIGGPEAIQEALNLLHDAGIESIDTAKTYHHSEQILGKTKAPSRFTIDTKHPGGWSDVPVTKESIIATANESLAKLQTDQVDVYYLHCPPREAALENVLDGINTLYKDGKIKRFGLSNFLAEEVDEVVRVAREKNYILPTVYQGNYSAIARRQEVEILPTLRRHGIIFYAYSPIAGGFLTKNVDQLIAGGEGRWDKSSQFGSLYHALYNKPSMLEGLRLWQKISDETGISKAELAYRWVAYNSELNAELGDGVIFGSTKISQLKETLALIPKGPLSPEIAAKIEDLWKLVEADSPLDNFNNGVL
ncbi:hypothetical protein P175DRAFT_0253059 [Aspergillus ochraceoroseus IBT 24754]|uniref:NADP-dependent oxidoreductase domain-containing protein n=1 Tax=Aspergillus ochraceoroseus IBT 24754 TaxID=1392256 RepID=A0A2T5LY83_9EURO|nr:uncharacterized protein P175DRAFT_0253059 [Aspergillus ochraceoroseus IBT 24754]PTU21254.1 hypothetical protein P175DRAFT_0253059 [Aspergillus ochraceoroseus IBT 24754]